MDKRATIPAGSNFYADVLELFQNKQKAGILYEDNGVTRANGFITAMFEKDGRQWFRLDENLEIPVDRLYAINGKFSSDYSEC